MDPIHRRNAANGYVWAYHLLKSGAQGTQYVEENGLRNPEIGWSEGVYAAIEDWEREQEQLKEEP